MIPLSRSGAPETSHLDGPQPKSASGRKRSLPRGKGARTEDSKRRPSSQPLRGITVAVSTLDIQGQAHVESQLSYAVVSDLCRSAGAVVTGQVHKKVSYVVCNPSAVRHATQRVRKAIKKHIPLVDVSWVRQCVHADRRIDDRPFRLESTTPSCVGPRKRGGNAANAAALVQDMQGLPDHAWTEPVALGCCCVCHENGDDDCPWCPDCEGTSTNARKRQRKTK